MRGGYIDSLIDGSELEKRLRRRFLESQQDRASGWARLPKSSNHKSSKETKGITGKERGDSEMSGEDDDVDVNFGDDADDDVDETEDHLDLLGEYLNEGGAEEEEEVEEEEELVSRLEFGK